ncbi:hypothetical protein TNCV_5098681 [Trichonephila clavipes]|uniref:Uncharacterized protein n=1 Tax=Trichonephila clavipes TaxID=2585209 RepID=A0A8X6S321_TRICX|nr:hypothetical protein TNCV_5098681 [Trichonephila clavipes]
MWLFRRVPALEQFDGHFETKANEGDCTSVGSSLLELPYLTEWGGIDARGDSLPFNVQQPPIFHTKSF